MAIIQPNPLDVPIVGAAPKPTQVVPLPGQNNPVITAFPGPDAYPLAPGLPGTSGWMPPGPLTPPFPSPNIKPGGVSLFPGWPLGPRVGTGTTAPAPHYPGGAPTATAKVPTKVVPKKKGTKKKGGGGGRGTAGVTVSDVDTDASAGSTASAAPTTAPPGSSIDPKWVLAQLKAIYGSGADPKKLAALASKLAAQAVQAQVAGITTQQQQLQDQGRSQALNILAASRAAANLQNNFGNVLNTAYGNAADETAKIAGGYAGQLQNTALAEQSDLAKQVAAAGGTFAPPGGANVPQDAYNALYGLQGAIPATALNNQAVTSMKQAQSLPMITRGGGTQTALLAQGAANQASNALFKNIQDAKNKLPALTQSYLNNLSSQDAANRKLKLAGLNTALSAMAKGDSTAFNQWLSVQKLGQSGQRIQLAKDVFNQNGQYRNATLKIAAFKANAAVNSQRASASAARIRANTAAKKAALAMGQSADKMGANLSKRIDALVKGVWTSPSYSGGRPQVGQLREDPKTPEEALRILLLEFGTLAGTPGGRNLIISELQAAYGPRRVVYPPGSDKTGIEYGWDPNNPETFGNAYQVVDGVLYLADK